MTSLLPDQELASTVKTSLQKNLSDGPCGRCHVLRQLSLNHLQLIVEPQQLVERPQDIEREASYHYHSALLNH